MYTFTIYDGRTGAEPNTILGRGNIPKVPEIGDKIDLTDGTEVMMIGYTETINLELGTAHVDMFIGSLPSLG